MRIFFTNQFILNQYQKVGVQPAHSSMEKKKTKGFQCECRRITSLKSHIAANKNGVCLRNTSNHIHIILKYGDYYTLWIGNDAVVKSSSQWQLKRILKNK